MALQTATAINTYGTYHWDSGFAKSAALLYDIPLKRIPRIAPWVDGQLPV